MENKTSIETHKTSFKENLIEKVQLFNFLQELPTLKPNYFLDPHQTIIIAKRTLKNTYIFG